MSTETQSAPAAAWYPDPGTPGALRWWDGARWTSHVSFPQPQLQPQPHSQPQLQPRQATHGAASSRPIANGYIQGYHPAPLRISNRASWSSLGLGGLSVVILLTRLTAGPGTILFSTSGIAAIVWGIVALVRVRTRRSTVVWAPIVGIVLGTFSSIMIVVALVLVATNPSGVTPAGAQSQQQQQQQQQSGVPPAGADQVFLSEKVLASSFAAAIEYRYNGNARTLSRGHAWPTLIVAQNSQLVDDAGTPVFTQPQGYGITYLLVDHTSFLVTVHSAAMNVSIVYDSSSDTFRQFCGPIVCSTDSSTGSAADPGTTT